MRISDWSSDVCSSDLILGGNNGAVEEPEMIDKIAHRGAVHRHIDGHHLRALGTHRCAFDRVVIQKQHAVKTEPKPLAHIPQIGRLGGPVNPDGSPMRPVLTRSEEHTSELQSLMRTSYAVFCL